MRERSTVEQISNSFPGNDLSLLFDRHSYDINTYSPYSPVVSKLFEAQDPIKALLTSRGPIKIHILEIVHIASIESQYTQFKIRINPKLIKCYFDIHQRSRPRPKKF